MKYDHKNFKFVPNYFLGLVGTSQETGDHADQAKGLLEEDRVWSLDLYLGFIQT